MLSIGHTIAQLRTAPRTREDRNIRWLVIYALIEGIEEGGLIWMLPIVFLSFYAVGCCLERAWYWLVYGIRAIGRDEILHKMFLTPADSSELIVVDISTRSVTKHTPCGLKNPCRNHEKAVENK